MPDICREPEVLQGQPARIRVYVVEDEPGTLEALADSLVREGDMEYVGGQEGRTPNLVDEVARTRADVVIVDLLLTTMQFPDALKRDPDGEFSGLAVIRDLRRRFGRNIKIVVSSRLPQYRSQALSPRVGADTFVSKAEPPRVLRQVIRDLMSATPSEHLPPEFVGRITGLALFPNTRAIQLVGDRGTAPRIVLERRQFTFVHFLALERTTQDPSHAYNHWVVKAQDAYYIIKRPEVWESLTQRHQSPTVYSKDRWEQKQLETATIAQWCAGLKAKLAGCHQDTDTTPTLICVPAPGRPRAGATSVYTLNADLTAQTIVIHD